MLKARLLVYLFKSTLLDHCRLKNTREYCKTEKYPYLWNPKLITRFYCCQPEAEFICKVVAGSTCPITFNKWSGAEIF